MLTRYLKFKAIFSCSGCFCSYCLRRIELGSREAFSPSFKLTFPNYLICIPLKTAPSHPSDLYLGTPPWCFSFEFISADILGFQTLPEQIVHPGTKQPCYKSQD